MEEENEAIIIAMIIGATILGIGLALFFNRPYTGFGAVVLAIGLMTLSLILTMRAEEIIHLKVYPTPVRSEAVADVSVETPSLTEPAAPEVQEVEEIQQPQEIQESWEPQEISETEETEQPYTPSMYEPSPPQEETTIDQEPQETSFEEPEQEQEPSIEASSPSLEEDQEAEELQESTTTVVTTN